MTDTPQSIRHHIVLCGRCNSGKSSLLNAITGQQEAIVSDVPGTTTDRVNKPMEIMGIGPCVLVDTAGLDDCGQLGQKRIACTADALKSADIVLAVIDATCPDLPVLPPTDAPVVPVVNKADLLEGPLPGEFASRVELAYGRKPVIVSALKREGIDRVLECLRDCTAGDSDAPLLTEGIISEGQLALLVMPQDRQAPKGRLILPQQQVIRELLDRSCRVVCCNVASLRASLEGLNEPPKVIIADSQIVEEVAPLKAEGTSLTSFSILLAAAKGDFEYFRQSAKAIDRLTPDCRVLIAEACTHAPSGEDIGRVQIPRLLRSRAGERLGIDVVSGRDFPEDLSPYALVIHCGACMFTRRYLMARVSQAKSQGIPMTNYGITIAYIKNLL